MTEKKFWKVIVIIMICGFVIMVNIMAFAMFEAYEIGLNQGREETVQMVSDWTNKYTFNEIQDNKNGGIMACFGNSEYFSDNKTLLNYYYDWDGTLKISLKK